MPACRLAVFSTFLCVLCSTAISLRAADDDLRPGEDWPIFLGPQGTGVSKETGLLDQWPEDGPPVLWKKKIGTGYSAPSVMGHRLVVIHRPRNEDIVQCLHAATGEELWKYSYDTDYTDPYGYNNGPRCTPLLTKNRCYTFGAQGKLLCLNLESGKLVWERDTATDWDVPENFFGFGCTPILESGLLIVLVGGRLNSGVVAFDPETGKTVWESVGKDTWNGVPQDERNNQPLKWTGQEKLVSYSSPIAATIHGKRHLLCLMRQGLVSLDPKTGELNFKYWFRAKVNESVNAARPVVIGDQILLSAAYETGSGLLKVKPDGKDYDVVWRDREGLSTHWSTPIVVQDYFYGFTGRHESEGKLQCRELQTGNLVWETDGHDETNPDIVLHPQVGVYYNRKTGEPASFSRGSKIIADGKFIVLGERGTLALVKIDSQKFRAISRAPLHPEIHYPAWAAPVLSRGRLYLRSEDHLLCLDLAKPK